MMVLSLSFIRIGVGQGNSTKGPEEFVRNEALSISDEIIQVRGWNFLVPYQYFFSPTL